MIKSERGIAAIVFLIAALIVFVAVAGVKYSLDQQSKSKVDLQSIQSFDDCVKAGFPVLQTYPEQCRTPDGRNFVKPTPIQSFPPNPQPTGVISSPGDQAPQSNTTANWKIYVDSTNGFSFKYPSNLGYSNLSVAQDTNYKETDIDFLDTKSETDVFILRIYKGSSLREIGHLEDFLLTPNQRQSIDSVTTSSVNGNNVTFIAHEQCLSGDCYDALIKRDDTIVDFLIPEGAHNGCPGDKCLIDEIQQMLATFKFTN